MKPYDVKNKREFDNDVDRIFLKRWSPRSLTNKGFTERNLMSLFEAARWAPSSSNEQPWRFLYALHGTKKWDKFYDLLVEFNQMWAKNSGALIVVLSRKKFHCKKDEKEKDCLEKANVNHSFDAGAAWMSLALQARMKNMVAHGMAGFSFSKARKVLKIPKDYNIEAMIAVGKQGRIEDLHERMQKSEKPNDRMSVSEFVAEGEFLEEWM